MTESNNRILSCPVKFPILQSNRISVNKTNLHCMAHQMPIVILLFIANSDFNLLSDIEKLLLQQEKQGSRCPLIRFLHDGSLLHRNSRRPTTFEHIKRVSTCIGYQRNRLMGQLFYITQILN